MTSEFCTCILLPLAACTNKDAVSFLGLLESISNPQPIHHLLVLVLVLVPRSSMVEVAAVGWAISTLGWIASPITTRLLNRGFDLLGFDELEKLRDLEERLLPRLELMRQQADRVPPGQRGRLERWARRLKSAFYHAEDILDVADYHRLEKQAVSQSGTSSAINRVKQITTGKNRKLKNALKKLENIIEEGSQLLTPLASTITSGNDISDTANRVTRITTTSSPTDFVIGRDKERDDIIRMLHKTTCVSEPNSSNSKCYSVVGIYGIAGSGKTTLAQHVCTYERHRTKKYFNPIMWVQVNQVFNVHGIYRQMLEAALSGPCHEFSNLDTLQMKLEAALRGKRFLLVLDDVWTGKDDKDEYKLDQLLSPLKVGNTGSKVLVTTRFADAAKYLGCHSPMEISDLNEMDFFNLFMHYALHDADIGDQEPETFMTIGQRIAEKLKRSPLAARVVGARLRKQLKAINWRKVEDHDWLTDTMGALWWSYQYLDEHVRRCFAYCSIFPQGYGLQRSELVDLWMAEGFIKSTGTVEEMEYKAHGYFDELVSCSFLQTRKQAHDTSEDEWVTTHDLLHELATMVAGDDCILIYSSEMKQFHPDVLHLCVMLNEPLKFTEQICKLENLRTLIIISIGRLTITIEELEGMLKKLKKLRVVQVPLQGTVVMIPACICDLKHLHSLTINTYNAGNQVHLPRDFGKLYHLQTLDVRGEGFLEFSNVKNMSRLISLRYLKNPEHQFYDFSEVSCFPGVGEMKSLRELSDFRVRKEKGYELQQLEKLNHLCGSLCISGLENVESKERALEAKLSDKKYLTTLILAWQRQSSSTSQHPDFQTKIIEGLCPPVQLTKLGIYGYSGWSCPGWLAQNFRNLRCLELEHCVNLEALPDISELFIHLDEFALVALHNLKKLPRLPDSLKRLDIQICEAIVETCVEDVEQMRSLFNERVSQIEPSLHIAVRPEEIHRFTQEQPDRFDEILLNIFGSRCTSFGRRLIRGQITEEDYSQFLCSASLDSLTISYCAITDTVLHNWWRVSTSLTRLIIRCLPFFTAIPCEVMMSLSMLQNLAIRDCVQFTCLQGLHYLSNLQHLAIVKCPNLVMTLEEAEKVQGLDWITVDDLAVVPQVLSREGFSSLGTLRVQESDEPKEEGILQLFPSLTSLILDLCKWSSLPENLGTLPQLQELSLWRCPNVRSLPTLPVSLRAFTLRNCDESFMKSCQTAGTPNWQKIALVSKTDFFPKI